MKSKVDNPTNAATSPVWLVRAGRNGEDEATALEQNLAIIGFTEFPDLSDAVDADAISARARQATPEAPERRNPEPGISNGYVRVTHPSG